MALSFKEKRSLTKTVNAKVEELNSGGLSFKDKRAATKALNDAVLKLTSKEIDTKGSKILVKLIAGEYDSLAPLRFLSMLEKAAEEIGGDIEPIKPLAISYIDKNKDSLDAITESALREAIEDTQAFSSMSQMPMPTGSAIRYMPLNPTDPEGAKQIIMDIDQAFSEPSTFRGIIQALENARTGDEADLKINSPGGRTDAAQAVYVALLETKAKTRAKIINAASSGSIVAMACDEIQTTPFCTMMIHNASAGTQGKVGDMAAASSHYKDHFKEWFGELYAGFLTGDEVIDVTKGQEFYLKEKDIKLRLKNWTPIRARDNDDMGLRA